MTLLEASAEAQGGRGGGAGARGGEVLGLFVLLAAALADGGRRRR
eukprot:CAMPEP_0115322688 /NCGR_PEP_ID=MMETSP0270-20121206/81535_1 /TAXON_ID=71861 /ORGANISM="Scrippsiella trochoidea, Strain CCMP3099" /LENGTH=44 /DNA_ID= /DNA_START= /DNA_END= /DNA_ORIENTATION=